MRLLCGWQDEGWIFAQTFFGITTYYQTNPNGSVRVKLEGHLENCQIFDMVRLRLNVKQAGIGLL
jgi:hypothetical protein